MCAIFLKIQTLEDTITKMKLQQCQLSDENVKLQGVVSQLEAVIKSVWLRFTNDLLQLSHSWRVCCFHLLQDLPKKSEEIKELKQRLESCESLRRQEVIQFESTLTVKT